MRSSKTIKERQVNLLGLLQKNCKLSIEDMAKKLKEPKSTVFYTLKEMEKKGYIVGYQARLNPSSLGFDFTALTFVRAKYAPEYHKKMGEKLANIKGIRAVYFLFGEIDFILVVSAKNRKQYLKILEEIMKVEGIVRTSSHVVADVVKEDFSYDLSLLLEENDSSNDRV